MNLRQFLDRFLGRNKTNGVDDSTAESQPQARNLQVFIAWIKRQNELHHFARQINNGTTVYFSDDFAACYDLRIIGFDESNNTIIVQEDVKRSVSPFAALDDSAGGEAVVNNEEEINEDFLEIAIDTWSKLNCEVWYVDSNLKWMIIANEKGRKRYTATDVIKSERLNFEFVLREIY